MTPSNEDEIVGAIQLLMGDLPPEEQRRILTKAVKSHSSVVAFADVDSKLYAVIEALYELQRQLDGSSPIGVAGQRNMQANAAQAVSYLKDIRGSLSGRRK